MGRRLADGLFAGVVAAGVALLALGAARHTATCAALGYLALRRCDGFALVGGVLLGCGPYLSYGLILYALPVLAAVLVGRSPPRPPRTLLVAAAGVALVATAFTAAGFWWLDGYELVVQRYYQGIAADRPFGYWVWANLACLVLAAGPGAAAATTVATTAAIRRGGAPAALRCLTLAALAAVLLADASGLSKAETERIWLPFGVWLAAATAVLPHRRRGWPPAPRRPCW